ncbi:hypothetical protein QYF36_013314 [Acer negundo]|nr:hypothetical protein QYF36_013314 [Acer negundo]
MRQKKKKKKLKWSGNEKEKTKTSVFTIIRIPLQQQTPLTSTNTKISNSVFGTDMAVAGSPFGFCCVNERQFQQQLHPKHIPFLHSMYY